MRCFLVFLLLTLVHVHGKAIERQFWVVEGRFTDLNISNKTNTNVVGSGHFEITESLYGEIGQTALPLVKFSMASGSLGDDIILTVSLAPDGAYFASYGSFQGVLGQKVWYQDSSGNLPDYATARRAYQDLWAAEQVRIDSIMSIIREGSILSSAQAVYELHANYPQQFSQLMSSSSDQLLKLPLGAQLSLDMLANSLIVDKKPDSLAWNTDGKRLALWKYWLDGDRKWSNYEFDLIVNQISYSALEEMPINEMVEIFDEGYSRIGASEKKIQFARSMLFAISHWLESMEADETATEARTKVIHRMNQYYLNQPDLMLALGGPWLGGLKESEFQILTSGVDERVIEILAKDRETAMEKAIVEKEKSKPNVEPTTTPQSDLVNPF